jgi:hypothetical protein
MFSWDRQVAYTAVARKLRTCRHCGERHVLEVSRGLCRDCHSRPKIRNQYGAPTYPDTPLPQRPCSCPPGSEERLREMERRRAAGVSLFHPGDVKYQPESGTVIVPKQEPLSQKPGQTGIERAKDRFRVRVFWRGKKIHLGFCQTQGEATAMTEAFWKSKLGLFWQHRRQCSRWIAPASDVESPRRKRPRRKTITANLYETLENS